MAVFQMRRRLSQTPAKIDVTGIALRTFRFPEDVAGWLELRRQAFARQRLGVRDWTLEDFEREFSARPWWNPEHIWLAVPTAKPPHPDILPMAPAFNAPSLRAQSLEAPSPIGAIALTWRGRQADVPAVHWLAVHPVWRRRGIAQLLLGALEARVWELGLREIWLETHDQWQAAVQFYQAAGYEVVEAGQ